MDTLRFLGLAALMFAATFLGMNWYLRVEPLKPDPRVPTSQHADPDSAPATFLPGPISPPLDPGYLRAKQEEEAWSPKSHRSTSSRAWRRSSKPE
jgi:hypothetical protein